MSLSLKGIARRFRNRTGTVPVRSVFFANSGGRLMCREKLQSLARQNVSFDASECIYAWTASYEQIWSHIIVRIRLNPDAGISNAAMAMLRTAWENRIESTWSNRWSIGRPGEGTCPITIDVQWVTSNAHHTVRVRMGPGQTVMTLWDTEDSGAVAAHEFGHMIGNPDEYASDVCLDRDPVNTGTVMDNNSNTVPSRLMQRFADNVGSNVL